MSTSKPQYLFSYGTLQTERVQLELFGRTLKGTNDVLPGYRISPIQIEDKAFLARGESKDQKTLVRTDNHQDHVEGTALELAMSELLIADAYEPLNYKRTRVQLQSGLQAWIYIAI